MMNLGEQLRQAREKRQLTLKQVESETKIPEDCLQRFEDSQFDFDLPAIYRRGLLKIYSQFLGLDPAKFIAQVGSADEKKDRPAARKESSSETVTPEDENLAEKATTGRRDWRAFLRAKLRDRRWLAYGGGTLVLLLIGFFFLRPSTSRDLEWEELLSGESADVVYVAPNAIRKLTLSASDEVKVLVREKNSKQKIFSGTLKKGTSEPVSVREDVQISYSDGNALTIQREGGEVIHPKNTGAGWVEVSF
ncbi:MAG: helix-turn-helix domain-containing protein [Puniceicoccales bacterium]|nr:helix-turn-helix domain-containing protein [Puniceicoccales bacterium]